MALDYNELDDLSNDYLFCRAYRHAWEENPAGTVDSDLFRGCFAVVMLRCVRCATERFDYLGFDMKRIGNPYYRRPDDYGRIHGDERVQPSLLQEMHRRGFLIHLTDEKPKRGRRLSSVA